LDKEDTMKIWEWSGS